MLIYILLLFENSLLTDALIRTHIRCEGGWQKFIKYKYQNKVKTIKLIIISSVAFWDKITPF